MDASASVATSTIPNMHTDLAPVGSYNQPCKCPAFVEGEGEATTKPMKRAKRAKPKVKK